MKAIFSPSAAFGTANGITSKSYAHRALILSHFAKSKVMVKDINDDISATISCLTSLKSGKLFCGESGSTLRFMLPIVSALGGEYEFTGKGRLLSRPLGELLSVLNAHGVEVEQTADKISVKGKLSGDVFKIRGDISSQYVSGLLMALPLIGGGKIELLTPLSSAGYVDITLDVMESFGVKVKREENGFSVPVGEYKSDGEYKIPCDWSAAAFLLSLGAVSGKVTVSGLEVFDSQGDKAICEILSRAGAEVSVSGDCVTAKKGELNGFTFDADNCPDLVPVLSAVAALVKGESLIKNVQRLRYKESDRVDAVIKMLDAVGIKAETKGDDLLIYGGKVTGGSIKTFGDHRIAMSAAVLGIVAEKNVLIDDALCVNKSYPSFYEDYKKLGGIVDVGE